MSTSRPTILVADDDLSLRTVLEQALESQGYQVMATGHGQQLLEWAKEGKGDLAITDVMMPDANGLALMPEIQTARPELPVIVISAQNSLMTAVKATEAGAYDYLAKPFDLNELFSCVSKSLAAQRASQSSPHAEDGQQNHADADLPEDIPLIGRSSKMQALYRTIARLIPLDLTVMLGGESGTGKELIARALHGLGKRREHAFVAVNMAAIPRELVESELFGHEKGAFTGATSRYKGKFEQADGGTLFLDEIGDMPAEAQTKLLRVLQEGEYTTVGGSTANRCDVRIICATHYDLKQRVADDKFREDLYYRLNVIPLTLPPLRERLEDIPDLCRHFLERAIEKGLPEKHFDNRAIERLTTHSWPGNIRELENLVYRLVALSPGSIISADQVEAQLVPANSTGTSPALPPHASLSESIRSHLQQYFISQEGALPLSNLYELILPHMERPLIELTLEYTRGNQLKAADILGINRNTLRKKIDLLGISLRKAGD